jgi:hypothetical protein
MNLLPQNDKERREWIYAAIAAWLRKEVVIDIDDTGFVDAIWPIQLKMAKEFDRKAGV